MTTLTFVAHKGGVGKTALSYNTGCALAKLGKRVLFVDLDAQGDLTRDIGCEYMVNKSLATLIGDYLKSDDPKGIQFKNYISTDDGKNKVHLIAGDSNLSAIFADFKMSDMHMRQKRTILRDIINNDWFIDHYDFVIFDSKTEVDIAVANTIEAADYAIVPTLLEVSPIANIPPIIKKIDDSTNCELLGIVVNRVKSAAITTIAKELWAGLHEHYNSSVFNSFFREQDAATQISEYYHMGCVNIDDNKLNGPFMEFAQEILSRIKAKS